MAENNRRSVGSLRTRRVQIFTSSLSTKPDGCGGGCEEISSPEGVSYLHQRDSPPRCWTPPPPNASHHLQALWNFKMSNLKKTKRIKKKKRRHIFNPHFNIILQHWKTTPVLFQVETYTLLSTHLAILGNILSLGLLQSESWISSKSDYSNGFSV